MGKNVLESTGVVLRSTSALPRLSAPFALLLATLLPLMAAQPRPFPPSPVHTRTHHTHLPHKPHHPHAHTHTHTQAHTHTHPYALTLPTDMMGIRVPHKSQWNISQTEYETKHREYFDLVEQNQRRRLNSSANYDEENIVRKKLYTFTHSGLKNSPTPPKSQINLNFDVHIPEESNGRSEVESSSLRLLIVPRDCSGPPRALALEALGPAGVLARESVLLETCAPKWVGLDLTEGPSAPRVGSSALRLSLRGGRGGLGVLEGYLNVVVEVRGRGRRRRAGKKRRRFPGRCVRHPWEVDLGRLKGYEYIVQPRRFDAGLCAGRCTGQWNLATQHSNLQYLFSNIDKSVPKPCCAPSKMESLEILYPDEDNPKKLKVSVWNDTKIVECACS